MKELERWKFALLLSGCERITGLTNLQSPCSVRVYTEIDTCRTPTMHTSTGVITWIFTTYVPIPTDPTMPPTEAPSSAHTSHGEKTCTLAKHCCVVLWSADCGLVMRDVHTACRCALLFLGEKWATNILLGSHLKANWQSACLASTHTS